MDCNIVATCVHSAACTNQVCVFMYAIPCTYACICGQGDLLLAMKVDFASKVLSYL